MEHSNEAVHEAGLHEDGTPAVISTVPTHDPAVEFEPPYYMLAADWRDNLNFLSTLETHLDIIKDAMRYAGHPDLDFENIRFEIDSRAGGRVTMRLPKKKHTSVE